MTIDQLREALQDRRLGVIAERTGVSENTIRTIRDGKNTNPSRLTMRVLTDYFKQERVYQ